MTSRSVVVLADYFVPANAAGGPIRSLEALSKAGLDGDLAFITRDRDMTDSRAFPGVAVGRWVEVNDARVLYLPSGRVWSVVRAWHVLVRSRPDCIYLNSLFAPVSGLLPLIAWKLRLLPARRLVIAPRGQLDPGALSLSAARKRLVLRILQWCGLLKNVRWHATSDMEADDIRHIIGKVDLRVVAPIPDVGFSTANPLRPRYPLRLVFLSRISPKKGLHTVIEALAAVEPAVELNVYGPEEDVGYANRCRAASALLPPQHEVIFHGVLAHHKAAETLGDADAFVLCTLGENFGHAIFEALAAACPVILTRRTPWTTAVEAGAGWLVDHDDPEGVARALTDACTADPVDFQKRSDAALAAAQAYASEAPESDAWQDLFWGQYGQN